MPIGVKIDVDKIDKSRFFKGQQTRWLDLILIETPNSDYGDYMVKQSSTKEEREKRVQLPIIGNAKFIRPRGANNIKKVASDEEEW